MNAATHTIYLIILIMPELPEVETVRRGLLGVLVGHQIAEVTNDWPKSFPNTQADVRAFLVGATITNIRRRAKVIIIDLDSHYSLVIHLKMTGQLVYVGEDKRFGAGHPTNSLTGNLPDASTRVIFVLDKGTLFFNDQRKFGWVRLVPTSEVENLDFFTKLGPEPLSAAFTASVFAGRVRRRKNSNIKSVLLDQSILAGVGNIYADESLWAAKIHPSILVRDITDAQFAVLYKELLFVLRLAIRKGGSTDRNYVNAEGKKGSYMNFARVFRRERLPCPRCGTTIEKIRVAGRGTHICPNCQKGTRR